MVKNKLSKYPYYTNWRSWILKMKCNKMKTFNPAQLYLIEILHLQMFYIKTHWSRG